MTNAQAERMILAFERIGEALSSIAAGYAVENANSVGVEDEEGGYYVASYFSGATESVVDPTATTTPLDYFTMVRLVHRIIKKPGFTVLVYYRQPYSTNWFFGFETKKEEEAATFLVEYAKAPPWVVDQRPLGEERDVVTEEE